MIVFEIMANLSQVVRLLELYGALLNRSLTLLFPSNNSSNKSKHLELASCQALC